MKEFIKFTLQIPSLTSNDLMLYFLDSLKKWAKQEVQRRQVHDVDEAIVVPLAQDHVSNYYYHGN